MNSSETTNTEIWNELQSIKLKLIKIEESIEQWSTNLEHIRQGFLEALEEFEASLREDNNG